MDVMRRNNRLLTIASVIAVLGGFVVEASAQKKGWPFASFKRSATPDLNNLTLSEQNGPWMILAGTFAGEGAEQEAQALVKELRSRFRMNAFLHNRHFDFSKPVVGKGLDKYGEPKQMRYRQNAEFDEFAVLVGDFTGVSDPNLQKTLKQIKYCQPQCLQLGQESKTTLRFAGLRALNKRLTGTEAKMRKGPLGSAFVTRNPMLPQEYFTPGGVDQFVARMNDGVKHSLLDCPKQYTVQVATFSGSVIIDPKKVHEVNQTGRMVSKLTKAAEQAHRLVEMLRERGVEAYEFHDRTESIVTIGSFDTVGTPRQDGKIEIDRRILKIIEGYGAKQETLPGGVKTGMMPRTLAGVPFDIQPIPVEVPKRSVAADYARNR